MASSSWRAPRSNLVPRPKVSPKVDFQADSDEDELGLPPQILTEHDNLLVNYYQLLPLLKGTPVTNEMIAAIIIAGFVNADAISKATTRQIEKVQGVSKDAAIAVKKRISSNVRLEGFKSAGVHHAKLQNRKKLTTGSKGIDQVLAGGWSSHSVIEVCGAPGTGKTQLMHMSAVTALLPETQGGTGKNVIFVDTEGSFVPNRLEQIAARYNLKFESIKERVIYSFATSTEHLYNLLVQAYAIVGSGAYGIVIVDSIAKLLSNEFNRGLRDLGDRQRVLSKILSICSRIAETGVIFLVTNQLRANITSTGSVKQESLGGYVMSHAVGTKVQLSKGEFGVRLFSLLKSPSLPSGQAVFSIDTFNGISDVKHEEDLSMSY